MAKIRTVFFCQNCGAQSPKWIGKCPSCNEWNTYAEEIIQKEKKTALGTSSSRQEKATLLTDVTTDDSERILLNDKEMNRVLGGGLIPGSIILFGGEPGIGKSTLMLQVALKSNIKVLYVSGEESKQQIKLRAERIEEKNDNCFILTETDTAQIFQQAKDIQPELLVIDSIQTLHTPIIESSPGSISQIRECTAELMRYSKENAIPVFLIGHITKDGMLAGPKILEHMVDCVLQFEGNRNHTYRILRTSKNRFGSTNEMGIYEMRNDGLHEVENPSEVLVTSRDENLSGIAVASTIEGVRPMLIEVQALVSTAAYGTPQRSATGFDLRRLNMLLAVLEKRCGFKLGAKDVFLNITGGIKVNDPAIDLAVVCAILSSNVDIALEKEVCFAAEIGLSGEIRPIAHIEQRIRETQKLGYNKIIISKYSKGITPTDYDLEIIQAGKIEEIFKHLFA